MSLPLSWGQASENGAGQKTVAPRRGAAAPAGPQRRARSARAERRWAARGPGPPRKAAFGAVGGHPWARRRREGARGWKTRGARRRREEPRNALLYYLSLLRFPRAPKRFFLEREFRFLIYPFPPPVHGLFAVQTRVCLLEIKLRYGSLYIGSVFL